MFMQFDKSKFMRALTDFRGTRKQEEIAKELSTNRSTISLLENGKQIPSLEIIRKFCEKTELDLGAFFIKEETDPILMMMGELRDSDKSKLEKVFRRIGVREKYIAISKRCE